jgi:5-methylcytosine-specific restriction endonuclease McrA
MKPPGHANGHIVWNNYKNRAKATKRAFEITEPEFRRLTSLNCVYCGSPPMGVRTHKNLNGDFLFNGLDRVDNSKGYTLKNVVPCCKQCNIAKRGLTVEEFKAWIRRVYKHITEKVSSPIEP